MGAVVPAPSIRITDRIAECDDGKRRPRHGAPTGITIHRIGLSLVHDMIGLAAAFRDTSPYAAGAYTGGELPYSLLVLPSGDIEQGLALDDVGPHARKWSSPTIGVALLGDFRAHAPSREQHRSTAILCAWLSLLLGFSAEHVRGHDELPGGSADPDKRCPGRLLSMRDLRDDIVAMRGDIIWHAVDAGVGVPPDWSEYAGAALRSMGIGA